MKTRTNPVGSQNIIGNKISAIRKSKGIKQKDFIARLQSQDMDINPTSYSKLEGQTRQVLDKEIPILAKALGVSILELFDL